MSPRAAWRLETLGFPDVAHYGGGVADWRASGLPIEGTLARDVTLGPIARTDAPTCGPRDTIGAVRDLLRGSEWETCMVVNEQRILLGRLHADDIERADADARAEDVMRPGPVTYRPDFQADQLLDVMEQRKIGSAPVTTSDGTLIGLVRREDLARVLSRPAHRHAA
jgi:Mg/Co/Ni transporter MgtE